MTKKRAGKLAAVLALILAMTFFMGMTVSADSLDPAHFDFEKMELYLAPGDVYNMPVFVDGGEYGEYFSVYLVGTTSKDTYVRITGNLGWSNVEIHVGKDETATQFPLWFYVDQTDIHDNVDVHVVSPINSEVPETRKAAILEAMGKGKAK